MVDYEAAVIDEKFEQEKKAYRKEKIAITVEDGMKSEYWKILKANIEKQIKVYDTYLESLNNRKLTEKDIVERNQRVFERKFMKWFLGINDRILNEQLTFLEKIRNSAENVYQRAVSFVKK